MTISSTNPTVPTESATSSLTITFNRNVSESDISGTIINNIATDDLTNTIRDYTMSGGTITYDGSSKGSYTINGSTVSVTLVAAVNIDEIILPS